MRWLILRALSVLGAVLAWIAIQFAETVAAKCATWAIAKLVEILPFLATVLGP